MPDNKPAARLAAILSHLEPLLTDTSLTPQQQTFIQHMHRTAHTLHDTARQIPATAVALRQILPVLGDSFLQPQQALVGYAKMLIDHPESFDGAALSASQRQALMRIHDESVSLYRLTERLRDEAFSERAEQRSAPPLDFDLNMLIWQHVPVYRYWLREEAVTVTVDFPAGLPPVHGQPYHIAELVRHLVITMGRDLIEYGNIDLSALHLPEKERVRLRIFCTGVQLLPDELETLFQKNGRHIYRQRIEQQQITLDILREPGVGAAIHLGLPPARRITGQSP
jgi:hypothetical protein